MPAIPQFTRFAAEHRGSGLGIVYGFRDLNVWDRFQFDAEGSVLGRTYSKMTIDNSISGPQAGLVAFKRVGPVSFYVHGLLVAGLNDGEIEQTSGIGQELVPARSIDLFTASRRTPSTMTRMLASCRPA